MRRALAAATVIAATMIPAGPASAANESASCVGILSSNVAHFRLRDDLARTFNETLHPAGQSVYSRDAKLHAGSVPACLGL